MKIDNEYKINKNKIRECREEKVDAIMNSSLENITNTTHSNSTKNTVEEIFSKEVTYIYLTISWTIIICSCLLNALSIAMYLTRRIRRTKFNFCLLQLAISNIVQQLGFLPYLLLDVRKIKSSTWYIESVGCGFVDGLSAFFASAFVTVYTICFMSVNWYCIIKKPLAKRTSKKSILCFLIILWLVGVLLIQPNLFTFKVDYKHGFCRRSETFGQHFIYFYKGILLFTGLILPVLIMCITYVLIILDLLMSRTTGEFKSSTKKKHRLKVIQHIGILIAVFLASWLPFGVYWTLLMTSYFSEGIKGDYEKTRGIKYTMLPCLMASILNTLTYGDLRAGFFIKRKKL